MPKRSSKKPGPTDANELAARIVRQATGQVSKEPEPDPAAEGKDPAAVELGRRGGKKGGKARAERMTASERAEAARRAARARWDRAPGGHHDG